MPHINELIDYAVGAFIVDADDRVLLVDHKALGVWICPGGHVELDEHPVAALRREVLEETGLAIHLLTKPPELPPADGVESLVPPDWFNIHPITPTHRHVGMFWAAVPAGWAEPKLAADEHNGIGWFTLAQLAEFRAAGRIFPAAHYYAHAAVELVRAARARGAAIH